MRRRHRRALFNVFAFSLLGIAVYLNLFKSHEANTPASNSYQKNIVKSTPATAGVKSL